MNQDIDTFHRSPLKWAGNKWKVLPRLKPRLPPGQTLYEPFVGSGVVFLNTEYDHYVLNDANADLILFYRVLKRHRIEFIDYARRYFTPRHNNRRMYERLRERFNYSDDPVDRAALLLYLNRHGYNGLFRVNSDGLFNVPFGRYKAPYFPDEELRRFMRKARRARFVCGDFGPVIERAGTGDVIYGDPPYVPLSDTSNFTSYTRTGFSYDNQVRLANLMRQAAARGAATLLSNHDTPVTRRLYRDAFCERFLVQRSISCNGAARGMAREVLASF